MFFFIYLSRISYVSWSCHAKTKPRKSYFYKSMVTSDKEFFVYLNRSKVLSTKKWYTLLIHNRLFDNASITNNKVKPRLSQNHWSKARDIENKESWEIETLTKCEIMIMIMVRMIMIMKITPIKLILEIIKENRKK